MGTGGASTDAAPADAPAPDAGMMGNCGMPGQICCAGNTCTGGGCCARFTMNEQRCVAAGAMCYARNDGNGTPTGGMGGTGTCAATGTECPGVGGMCMNGRCAGCGTMAMPCCGGRICYDANLVCNGGGAGTCGTCGGANEPTCDGNVCSAGLCVNVNGV